MARLQVAVLGCGAIFSRHLAALESNHVEYDFVGYFDPNVEIQNKLKIELAEKKCYSSEDEVFNDSTINCIVILTPSYLHFKQAKRAILLGKNVIVEKPVSFNIDQIVELDKLSITHNVDVLCVLQVRLNPSIEIVKRTLEQNLLGDIRSSSLVQRWQRPVDYFSGWRSTYAECGGVLFEFGIHYLDIMQYLLGMPMVKAATFYNTKYKNTEVADSVYSLLDFGGFGGTIEICLTAEPHNIEVSLIIWGSQGFIKLGGKSLDQILEAKFANDSLQNNYIKICNDVLGYTIGNQVEIGACPHHPELYRRVIDEPKLFNVMQTYNVIKLISEINLLESSK